MNSNEEYLDSLLKAVTTGQGLETDIEVSDKKTEDEIETEFIIDAPEWDENTSDMTDAEDLLFSEEAIGEEENQEETPAETDAETDEENVSGSMSGNEEETANDELGNPDNVETEEELEDLILAADSTEEALEEEDQTDNNEEGFQEISDLLAGAGDSDEEMLAMLGGVDDEGPSDIGFFDTEEEENQPQEEPAPAEEADTGKKKKKKSKKGRKRGGADTEESTGTDQEEGTEGETKKQGIFGKFMDFLFEEDEEEAESGGSQEADIDDLLMGEATDENAAILAEIDKENENKKPDKKEKKKKGKKGKKGKENEAAEEGEEGEEGAEEKGKKPKKEKKKKEKKVKEDLEPEKPGKKISPKKIQAIALLCLTVAAAIILVVYLIPPTLEKKEARDAYYDKDYAAVVDGFYGEKLSESDELMYNRAVTILKFQRKLDAYNNYMYMGKETEALNQLIEAINRYEEIYEDAVAYNVIGEIDSLYQTVLDALQNRYGLSISQAMGIYAIEDDFEYTLALESIIDGVNYTMPEPMDENPEIQSEMPVEEQPEIQTEMTVEEQPEIQPEMTEEEQLEMQLEMPAEEQSEEVSE